MTSILNDYSNLEPSYLRSYILNTYDIKERKELLKKLDIKKLNREVIENVYKIEEDSDKVINSLKKEKEQLLHKLSILYGDRCDGVITAGVFKELTIESEKKIERINLAKV